MNITGPRLSLSTDQQVIAGGSGYGFQFCAGFFVGGCGPGVLSVAGQGAGSDFIGGTATLDGVSHYMNGLGLPGFDALSLFVTGSVLLPEFGNIESVVLAAPFGLTGQLLRSGLESCFPDPFVCSGDPFSGTLYSLHGQGILHLAMHRQTTEFGDFWVWDSGQFDLQPIPEPATLLLWGT